jgi:hypothetical protein
MQQPFIGMSRLSRVLAGTVISAALLIASPLLVYRRPRQHMAIGLATMSYMAALTMLDWCFLQTTAPSVRAMLSSFVWQPMSGIMSAHKAKQKALHAAAASSEAPSEHHMQQRSASQLLRETLRALLHLLVLMDVV